MGFGNSAQMQMQNNHNNNNNTNTMNSQGGSQKSYDFDLI